MRLATFEVRTETGTQRRIGIENDGTLTDLTTGYAALLDHEGEPTPTKVAKAEIPPDMIDFLKRGEKGVDAAKRVNEHISSTGEKTGPNDGKIQYQLDSVRLLSPLPRPTSLRDFSVYEEHIARGFPNGLPDVWYDTPVFYKANPAEIKHPGEDVAWPDYSEKRDYELEIAAVIGKKGRNIDVSEAEEYIAGYTIFNDFSARDTQFEEMKMNIGPSKGKDFANALGPYLVLSNAIDVGELAMEARVNGEVISEGSSGGSQHSWAEIVAHVSDNETIYPGDVLGSGTIGGGSGWENDRWLDKGDEVTLEIEGIGELTNKII